MKLLAIVLAAVLATSLLPVTAHAQSPLFLTEQQIKVTYKGGGSQIINDITEFSKLSLVAGSKEIDYFEFRTLIQADVPFTLKTISGLNPSIKVMTSAGVYAEVSQSGRDFAVSRYLGAPNMWQVYYLKVSASTIDSLIGQRTSDIDSNIRFATHTGQSFLTISTDQGNYKTLWGIATANFKALKSGVISEPTPGGSTSGDKPTGKVYHTVHIVRTDGKSVYLVNPTQGQLATFDIAVIGQGEPIKEITFLTRMHLDRDVYNVGNSLLFANTGATNNYGVLIDGKGGIANEHSATIRALGSTNTYELLRITVQGSEIEKHIVTEVGNDGKLVYKSGTIEFFAKPSYFSLVSPTNSYQINIPAQSVKYNLLSSTVIDGGTPCEIEGENCNPTTPGVDFSSMNPLLLVGGFIAAVGAVVVFVKSKRR